MKKVFILSVLCFVLSQTLIAQKSMPNIELKTLEGKSLNVSKYSKGKLLIFSFWATYCVPCMNELDAIAEQYDDWKDEVDFELIAVSIDDARAKSRVKPLVNGKGWEYQILLDTNQDLKRALNISSVPYVIIVQDGKIVYSHSGYTPGSEEALLDKLIKLSK